MEDYEIDSEVHCCKCGHSPLHYRDCSEFECNDGYKEEFFDDIEIEGMGDMIKCQECKGTGVEWWCPNCGENLSGRLTECGWSPDDDEDKFLGDAGS